MSTDETREALAALLAAHWEIEGTHAEGFKCTCGYGLGDGTGDPDGRLRAHFAEVLIESGLVPEGTTTEEWQTVSSPALRLDRRTPPLDGEQQARFTARCNRGSVVVHRTRTTYPDRVTDWKEVQ